ncbi:protein FAR1-RELATED SEQUENCE 6-like [Tripterygium wilfordii]|uniref:protein FAR1-RELATED SEQUENCE 6-like n=1 Tax=Tripterygium wilfordii TaxID=458696 RepID=UPI0018F82A2D|nr:protein FAR1-RELATED SEQUENCE 6-like [Tripterygium wilfordii]
MGLSIAIPCLPPPLLIGSKNGVSTDYLLMWLKTVLFLMHCKYSVYLNKLFIIWYDSVIIEDMVSLDDIDSHININQVACVNDCVEIGAKTVGSNVPVVGMLFESVDEMFKFYKEYGQVNGFSVKRRSLTKDANGDYKYLISSCGRSDKFVSRSKNPVNHRGYSKNECKGRLVGRLSIDGKWKITLFEDVHNHNLSPSHSRFFVCNREINPTVKRQLEINDIAGIRPNKSFNSFVIGAGGHDNIQFLERDTRNRIARTRRLRLGEGDANVVHDYFLKMQANNQGFFSLIDWDDDGRLRNVFWADPRSRAAYHEFGDIVTFDMTYLTNKYDMPFAPFVGVNHHGQSILLGCGLISSEDTQTFVWLFTTWLACMGGVAPHGIITDQDRAMKNAIEIVFPNTRHRLCLWHIMKKVPEKFGSHGEYESIKRMLAEAVYDSHRIEDFENNWSLLIYLHNLDGNYWLDNMYMEKEKWVPIYVKKYFWAGMSTTGRSESMNAFFDGYVNSKTTLKQFVKQYSNALRKKIEKECQADFDSANKKLVCVTKYEMQMQMQNTLTHAKFLEFQKELSGMMYCGIKSMCTVDLGTQYILYEDIFYGEGGKKKVMFTVMYDGLNVGCSCLNFEFRGILCRHAIIVLLANDEYLLSAYYIFPRWRKDVRRCHSRVKINFDGWTTTNDQVLYDHMCKIFARLADLAAENEHHYSNVIKWIEGCINNMATIPRQIPIASLTVGSSISNDPIIKRGKGRPRSVMKKKVFKRNYSGNTSNAAGGSGTNGDLGC